MAKYYLGKSVDGIFEPILLPDVGTAIKDIIEFTTSYISEIDLREELLARKYIKYYDDEIAYIKEIKQGDTYSYTPILLGRKMCTVESKHFFDPPKIRQYCLSQCTNSDMYRDMAIHFMRKLKITDLIFEQIRGLSSNPYALRSFLAKCQTLSEQTAKYATELLKKYENMSEESIRNALGNLSSTLYGTEDDYIAIYYYFKNYLGVTYTTPVDNSIRVYNYIKMATRYTDTPSSNDLNKIHGAINQLLDSIMHRYDRSTSDYKKDHKGYIVFERNIVDFGLFLASYAEYEREIRYKIDISTLDDDHEDFLEEEDFKRMHTTSEREGFSLRKIEQN